MTADESVDPRIQRLFREIADSEGQDFAPILEAAQRDQASFPPTDEMYETQSLLWEAFESCRPELGGTTPHAQLLAWAWVAQTLRQSRSAFRLVAEGYPDSACANARAAFEHGIYVSLLADAPDVDLVLDRLERRYIDVGRALAKGVMPDNATDLALLGDILDKWQSTSDIDPSSDWVRWMKGVCDRLIDGDTIYGHYQGLSTLMHCGFGSAEGFLVAALSSGSPDEPRLTHEPLVYETKLILWASIGACAWAGWSADKLFGFEHFTPVCDLLRPQGFVPLRLRADPIS
jgi:hypothetical protein